MSTTLMDEIPLRLIQSGFKKTTKLVLVSVMALTGFLPTVLYAQSTDTNQPHELHLTLEKALDMARENNAHNKMADEDVKIVRSQYRQTNALFLPQISVEETAISTNNPLNVFGSLLKQEVVTAADFNPAKLNNPDRTENYTTSINVRQPLLNPSGIMKRQAVKKQLDATRMQKKRTKEYVDLQVKKTWYQFILMQRKTGIIDTALNAAQANMKQARDFFKQGMMNKADLLAAKVRTQQLQSDRSKAQNDLENVQRQLAYLLGVSEGTQIMPDENLKMPQVSLGQMGLEPLIRNRSDMRAMEYQIAASRKKLTSEKLNFLPSVNLFGTYEWNDAALLGTNANSYMIGATLQWDLFKGFKNVGSIQQSQAQLSKVRLQYQDHLRQNRVELQSERRSLQTAREQVQIARTTVAQARESYRIRHNRYKQGMQNMSDLLTAEATLSQSKLKLAAALFQYNVQLAKLEYLLEQNLSSK